MRHGFGVEINDNGNVYLGSFVKNKKHSNEQFYWFTLSEVANVETRFTEYYSGNWWGNLPDGKGSLQKANGSIYDGDFKNGVKHGEGEEYFPNADSYHGNYVNGFP